MKNTLIAFVVGALTLTAAADKPNKGKKPGKGLPPAIAKFDKNKDGKIDPKERAEAKKAFFAKYDKNKDGKICKKEREAVLADRAKQAKARKKPAGDKKSKKTTK